MEAKFRNSKFIVRDKEEYDKLIKALYYIGCQWWCSSYYDASLEYNDDCRFIFVDNDGDITRGEQDWFYIQNNNAPVAIKTVLDYVEEEEKKANSLNKLKPFDKILVVWSGCWRPTFFGGRNDEGRVLTTDFIEFKDEDVIPYENNENLANTLVCQD